MKSRTTYNTTGNNKPVRLFFEDENLDKYEAQIIIPIVMQGDPIGTIIFISKEVGVNMGEIELKLAETAASFLSKQMES